MAEIKSTLEKVMERVAGMDLASREEIDADEKIKEGMRLAADFLRNQTPAIGPALAKQPEAVRTFIRQGVIRSLLRNIILPREEDLQNTERAMQGLFELGEGNRDIIDILSDMKQVLDRYQEHKNQLHQQLEDAMRQQLEQALARQGLRAGGGVQINPTLHPKFREEWQRLVAELNEQYGQALDQQKDFIAQVLGG